MRWRGSILAFAPLPAGRGVFLDVQMRGSRIFPDLAKPDIRSHKHCKSAWQRIAMLFASNTSATDDNSVPWRCLSSNCPSQPGLPDPSVEPMFTWGQLLGFFDSLGDFLPLSFKFDFAGCPIGTSPNFKMISHPDQHYFAFGYFRLHKKLFRDQNAALGI